MTNLKVFFSNQVEHLFKRLKSECFNSPPFARRLLVVPNPAVKSWLMLQFAKDPEIGIAAGFEIVYLPQAVELLNQLKLREGTKTIPSLIELMLAIEIEIKKILARLPSLTAQELQLWKPLFAYLKILDSDSLSRKSERRLLALSEKLAHLFTKYGLYGTSLVDSWVESWENRSVQPGNREIASGWQQELWKLIFNDQTPWTYPARELLKKFFPASQIPPIQVHIFAISFVSRPHHSFFADVSAYLPINYFLLSPCRAFWSDIYSDRERKRMQFQWRQQGLSQAKQMALEEYLRERNALLANYGRLGREMAAQIEESLAQTCEDYEVAAGSELIPQYEEFLEEEPSGYAKHRPLSLLEAVQTDMLLLRNPENQPKIDFPRVDESIQLHLASSPMREVEILYQNLMSLIDRERLSEDPICPGEIIVMAPDILQYEPYIKAVFGQAESQLDWQLMDLQLSTQSSLVQGFLFLLNLCFTRWDASSILQLFDFPEFQRKQQLSGEEFQSLFNWIKDSGIRWGEDLQHRNELLKRDHCTQTMFEESAIGTWDYGISRLLYGLAMVLENREEGVDLDLLPFASIDSTQSDLLGKLISLLRSLREDLQPLSKGIELALTDWAAYLHCLCEAYFSVDHADQEDLIALQKHFSALGSASKRMKEAKFTFTSVKHYLEMLLKQETVSYRENHLQAVRFCSMLPMRAIPAKVICLLGMEEGAFPKSENPLSLNLMVGHPHCDYCPSSIDYDRFLFLEVLLSARKTVLFSFTADQQKEALPSLLVTELMSYLDSAYTIQGGNVSKLLTFVHPFYPFDKTYFSGNPRFKNYSENHYRAAQAFYGIDKQPKSVFIPEFFEGNFVIRTADTQRETLFLDLKLLSDFAKNPLKIFFNKTLGIYISSENKRELQNDESFVLSRMDNGKLRKAALTLPIEQVLTLAEKEGILPLGAFKEIAKEQLRQEVLEIQPNLAAQGISSQDIRQIEFNPNCQHPHQDENGLWQYPAIEVNTPQTKIKIVGRLNHATPNGLIVHGKGDSADLFKIWPQLLMMQAQFPTDQLIPTKKNQSIPSFVKDPRKALERYVSHYLSSQQTVSFLLPEWIPDLLKEDAKTFAATVQKSLKNDKFTQNYNDYLLWAFSHTDFPASFPHFDTLRSQAEELFNESL